MVDYGFLSAVVSGVIANQDGYWQYQTSQIIFQRILEGAQRTFPAFNCCLLPACWHWNRTFLHGIVPATLFAIYRPLRCSHVMLPTIVEQRVFLITRFNAQLYRYCHGTSSEAGARKTNPSTRCLAVEIGSTN